MTSMLSEGLFISQAKDLRPMEMHVPLQQHGDVPWTEHREKSLCFPELVMNFVTFTMKWRVESRFVDMWIIARGHVFCGSRRSECITHVIV